MKNKILNHLTSLSKNDISVLFPTFFPQGFDYFSQGKVIAFAWFNQDSELVVGVLGSSGIYQIKIGYNSDKNTFRYVCNCSLWNDTSLCKHAVCTLLTAAYILNDRAIPGFAGATLRKQLCGDNENFVDASKPKQAQNLLTLHLLIPVNNYNSASPRCEITLFYASKELRATESLVPSTYKPFLNKSLDLAKREKLLREALTQHDIDVPIMVRIGKEQMLVSYDGSSLATPITELDIVDNQINVRRLAMLPGQETMQEIIQIGERLIVNCTDKKLVILNVGDRWQWAKNIINKSLYSWGHPPEDLCTLHSSVVLNSRKFPVISAPVIMPIESFNRTNKMIVGAQPDEQSFVFKQSGTMVIPAHIQPKLSIEGTIDKNKQLVYLHPQVHINDCIVSFDQDLHDYLSTRCQSLPGWLQTKGRRPVLLKAIFSLIGMQDSDQIEKFIETTAQDLHASYAGDCWGSEVSHYLERFHTWYLKNNVEHIVTDTHTFYRMIRDYHYLWKPYQILSEIFDGFYNNEHGQSPGFSVPIPLFFDAFAALEKSLSAHDITLRLNKKQVKTVAMDVAIDATREGGNDWFDVAPEILSSGIPLTEEQRDVLFAGSGILEDADCFTLLDEKTREIIKLLAKIFMVQGAVTRKNEHNIVQLPRLRILDLLELRKSGACVKLDPEDEFLVEGLTNFSKIASLPLPKKFNGELRKYQHAGYCWLAFLYTYRFGACLADDMGLGKTVQTIAFLGGIAEEIIKNLNTTKTPHLIVVPPTLIFNWQHELQAFYPALRTQVYAGMGRKPTFNDCDIVLTTYDTVRLDIDDLKKITFHVVIFDEVQAIKNIQSARTAAARQLKGIFTISLTGTPLENHIGEYYSIFDVALPGLLPTYKEFMALAKKGEHENLIKKMNVFVLRRTKDTILKELPPKVESNIVLEMTSKQQKVYATTVIEVKRRIEQAYESKTGAQANIIALTALLRLRQICVSPQLIDDKSVGDAPKIEYLIEALIELVQEGRAALIFSQFTACLDIIEKALKLASLEYYRIDGSTPMPQRKKIVESFQNNDENISILLMSLKTGGVGLNLTRANYVFHVDPWWNPAVENQASDRSHRIGQSNTVFVTRLVMHQTIEEKMMALKEAKQKLFQDVMENAENKKTGLISKKDFDMLLA